MFEEYELTIEEANQYLKDPIYDAQRVRDFMKSIIGDKATVVDIGCGRGLDAKRYHTNNYTGVDYSINNIKIANEENPDYYFIQADARILPFEDKQFDYAITKSVLEHTPNEDVAREIVAEMLRVADKVIIARHTPPKYDVTEIIQTRGHFGKTIYQNHYRKDIFDKLITKPIRKIQVDNFEVWELE